ARRRPVAAAQQRSRRHGRYARAGRLPRPLPAQCQGDLDRPGQPLLAYLADRHRAHLQRPCRRRIDRDPPLRPRGHRTGTHPFLRRPGLHEGNRPSRWPAEPRARCGRCAMSVDLEIPSARQETGSDGSLPSLPAERLAARRRRRRRGYALFALFAFPNLALIAVFAYWPVVANLYLSLTSWDFISPEPLFVGLTNYTSMFASPSFHKVLWVSVVWVVVVVGVSLVAGVLLAALFSKKLPGTGAVTGIVFTPHVVSGAAIAVVWLFIFDPNYGLARVAFDLVGAQSPNWTTDADWALPALLIVSIWQGVGCVSIVYLAGIQGLPSDVLEAAQLDGASSVQTFVRVVLPLLSPTTFFLVITQTMGAFQAFDIIAVMTNGGPASQTTTLSWFIYEQAFTRANVGLSAAAGTVMFVLLMIITALQFRFVEKKVHY